MMEDNNDTRDEFRVLSRTGREAYQRITGNEGPSPLLKRYFRTRKKRHVIKPVATDPEGS